MKNTLNEFKSVDALLDALGTNRSDYFSFIRSNRRNLYHTFKVKRKSGDPRQILAPIVPLKSLQRKLIPLLEKLYMPTPAVHGFVMGRSIVTSAERHLKKRYVLNFDLANFFPTITKKRIVGLLVSNRYGLDLKVANFIAHLVTYNGTLPQGAPTSPIISNMMCSRMDSKLRKLAATSFSTYTRYADDITFSTTLKTLSPNLGFTDDDHFEISGDIQLIIKEEGFEINPTKTRLQGSLVKQKVTGIKVNKILNVDRQVIREMRHLLQVWRTKGEGVANTQYLNYHKVFKGSDSSMRNYVIGKIAFISMVRTRTNLDDVIVTNLKIQLTKCLDPDFQLTYEEKIERILTALDGIKKEKTKAASGYKFEEIITSLLRAEDLLIRGPFKAVHNSIQIDGHAYIKHHNYWIECKWIKRPVGTPDLGAFHYKLMCGSPGLRGIFISQLGYKKTADYLNERLHTGNGVIVLGIDQIKKALTSGKRFEDLILSEWHKLASS